MRLALVLCALILSVSLPQRVWAATQACAWIVETVEDDGGHKFELNLSADAAASVSVRFKGPDFTSASMGGEMIQLDPAEPKEVDGEGFDVSAGDDLKFVVQLFDHPLSLDEAVAPAEKSLATFVFHRTVGADEHTPPADLAVKQCGPVG
jgi:hypothetical protein